MDILLREDREGVAILTLNRPEGLNALSGNLARALQAAVEDCIAGGSVRCILLTGAGRGFCSGADLGEKLEADPGKTLLETWYHPMVLALRHCPIPIVAAVNGVAAGAGMSLALLADIILCSENASFLQAFARIGLVPDCGSSWLVTRRIGESRARELTLLAEKLSAEKALAWGLVNRVCPAETLMDEAVALASRLANGPVNALGRIRALHESAAMLDFDSQLAEEDRLQRECGAGSEVREGRTAFLEKRPPNFGAIPRGQ
ncbi:enoyl-CoA hydratase-related protein [Pararhodobacter aggregans]|uniref:enoyl-CoA hydratase-related protein n=1 Tax=Pararhodobacter aggregans TaxID=404875 RepID=UPI003A92EE32